MRRGTTLPWCKLTSNQDGVLCAIRDGERSVTRIATRASLASSAAATAAIRALKSRGLIRSLNTNGQRQGFELTPSGKRYFEEKEESV